MHSLEEIKKNIAQLQQMQREEQAKLRDLDEQVDVPSLSKADRINKVWALPALSQYHMDTARENGFVTGSSIYSDADPSDIDICCNVPPTAFEFHSLGCSDQGYWEADGFTAIYGHFEGQLINIICFSDVDLMDAWYQTTQLMSQLRHMDVQTGFWTSKSTTNLSKHFNTKWKRVMVFRAIKDILVKPKPLDTPLDKVYAVDHRMCKLCGREAVNFTCKQERELYLLTGICERCSSAVTDVTDVKVRKGWGE